MAHRTRAQAEDTGRPTQQYILDIKLSDGQNNCSSRRLVFIITTYHLCRSSPRLPPGTSFVFGFINDLPDHVNIPTELYADDALLHHTFKRSTTALSVIGALQTAVLAAEQWALQWHGRFGHAKTKQLIIGQRQNLPLATVIEDHQIEEVVRHKHLGITFTSDLKWNVHIQEVIGNAAKRAGLLRWMSHHLRGPLITHLYLTYVRPTMEYASPLWHGSIRDEDALQLESIQAAVARRILHAPWDIPKRQLLEELNWPSLRWRREIASLCLLHQLLQE